MHKAPLSLRRTLILTSALATFFLVTATTTMAGIEEGLIRTRGTVIDPHGKPVAGARVTIPGSTTWETRLHREPAAQTTTGPDGRFELSVKKADLSPFSTGGGSPGHDRWKQAQVVASAEGFGIAFAPWDRKDDADGVVLKLLEDDVPIECRVLDLEGQPVAGVKVHVQSIEPIDEKEIQAAYKKDPKGWAGGLMLGVPFGAAGIEQPIVSDQDGRFRVSGIGRGRKISMYLSGERIGFTRVEAATKIMEPIKRVVPQPSGIAPTYITYPARFDYTAVPGRTVRGVITDAATKKPMAGVVVKSMQLAGPFQGYDPSGMIRAVTDEHGRYTLHGFPKGKGNALIVQPNDEQPYFQRSVHIEDEPGLAPLTIDVELHRGIWVTGKVTDKVTGEPQPARMIYTTYVDNPATHALPEFERTGGAGFLHGEQSRWETKPDGTYRLVAAPGKAIIGVWCMKEGYRKGAGFDEIPIFQKKGYVFLLYQQNPHRQGTNVVKEVDVPADAEGVTCDLQLDPGEKITVTVLDPGGQPAERGFHVRGHEPENYGGWHADKLPSPTFDAVGFAPGDERTLFVVDDERKLGRAVNVKFDDVKDGKLTIELQPVAEVRGRLTTADGDPLAGVSLEARQSGSGGGRTLRSILTDADGRFTTTLLPGVTYYIMADRGKYAGRLVAKEITPEAGGKVDLGDVKLDVMMR